MTGFERRDDFLSVDDEFYIKAIPRLLTTARVSSSMVKPSPSSIVLAT